MRVEPSPVLEALRAGIAAARAGSKVEARRLLREATETEPGNEHAWLWLAGVAENAEESLICLQRVLAINPEHAQARQGLATTRLQIAIAEARAGKKRTARRLLLEITRAQPDNELAWLWLAGVAETPQDGVAFLQRVLELNPGHEHARRGLKTVRLQAGIAEANGGNQAAARRYFRAITEDDASDEVAWQWLAEVAENSRETFACLERALAINPANQRAQETYASYRSRFNQATGGWQCPLCRAPLAESADLCPGCGGLLSLDDVEPFFTGAAARSDKLGQAFERCQTETEAGGDFASFYNLGLCCANLRRFDAAVNALEAALAVLPGHSILPGQLDALRQRKQRADDEAAADRARRKAILIVDDSPTVRKLVSLTLEKQGYRVEAAADAVEAQQCLKQALPELILMDITMPGMDGYQLCKLVTGTPRTAHIPVVMLSGKDGFFDKIRGRIAGSTQYVTKPFTTDTLIQAVQRHCPTA